MKKIFTITFTAITLFGCNSKEKSIDDLINEKNIKALKTERTKLVTDIQKLEKAIAGLESGQKLALVSTQTINHENFEHYIEVQGNVETKQNILIYPEFSGNLRKLLVKEGQAVSKGQTIAIIDDAGMSEQLAQVQTAATLAKTTYERQANLWKQKIGSEIQYLQAKTNYESQTKTVAQIKAQLEKTKVKAPFSGVIDDIITEEGSLVAPGQTAIARIVNLKNMTITANIPENNINYITVGKKVIAEFPVLNKQTITKITQAGNFINPENRNYKVEMAIPANINAKPNMMAKLKINDYNNNKAILIPQSIVSENENNDQYVYIIEKQGNKTLAKKIIITTGKTQGDVIEVIDGLFNNDQVIIEGARSVKEGQEVSILK